jgi:AraC-type DNA-binding domain-containing proteins
VLDYNEMAGQFAGNLVTVVGVFKARLPANGTFHSHTAVKPTPSPGFVFVTRGSGSFRFNEATYDLQAGTVLHGGQQMALTMSTGESELEYILVRYTLKAAETSPYPSNKGIMDKHFIMEAGTNPILAGYLEQLYESFYTPGNMALVRTGFLFNIIVFELFSACLNRMQGGGKEMVEHAKRYIHNHYMEPLNLRNLSERHGTNPKSFSYFFKKYTGVFPIDYLIQHRMKRAQELLVEGNYTIKQVAESVGYEDALYFSRLYKKHYGYAPSQAR